MKLVPQATAKDLLTKTTFEHLEQLLCVYEPGDTFIITKRRAVIDTSLKATDFSNDSEKQIRKARIPGHNGL